MYAAVTMPLGIDSFGDCRANFLTNFLITFSKWQDSRNVWVASTLGVDWQWLTLAIVSLRRAWSMSLVHASPALGGVHNLASQYLL